MAPRGPRRGEAGAEPQGLYKLGQQGRKTGVSLADTGRRDEQGFAPLDSLFSSPMKAPAPANGGRIDDEEEEEEGEEEEVEEEEEEEEEQQQEEEQEESDDGSEAMDIPSSAGPGPNTVLKQRRETRLPPSQSPAKASLRSPPRRNPVFGSSPVRSSPVTRRLDFSGRTSASRLSKHNGTNGQLEEEPEEEENEEEEEYDDVPDAMIDAGPPAFDETDMVDALLDNDDSDDEGAEVEVPSPPRPAPKKGRPPGPTKGKEPEVTKLKTAAATRKRQSFEEPVDEEEEPDRQPKRQKTTQAPAKPPSPKKPAKKPAAPAPKAPAPKPQAPKAPAPAKPKPGKRGRPAKTLPTLDEDAGEASFVAIPKGPPMPKRRGLVSMKRDPGVVLQTRSGRHSFKPLNYWAGEQVVQEVEEQEDMFTNDRDFVLPSMKEIIRVDEDEETTSKRRGQGKRGGRAKGGGKSGKASQRDEAIEEVEEPEEWELNPGNMFSEVIAWEPEYELHPPGDDDQVHISEEQIAISGAAVRTQDIHDASFRFAKTLTMPFMGAGVVDLPPGSEKRPKNSRKMHMVFFVHYGKVAVTVNEGHFRISAGGQWFVPRGNYYSISNDYQAPARIFFAQACEVQSQAGMADQSALQAGSSGRPSLAPPEETEEEEEEEDEEEPESDAS